jgi:hypothetical protein
LFVPLAHPRLHGVSSQGLTIAGSGSTEITTPRIFAPLQPVVVVIDGAATTSTASASGQIKFKVDLGTADAHQQFQIGNVPVLTSANVIFLKD